jgi:RND family efflux transporter MFP subunit
MNGSAQGSVDSGFFFGPFLTKCRKSAIGLFVFLSMTGVTVAGRWLLASSADARKLKPAEAPATSVRVVEVRDEVVASSVRYSAVVKELNKAELSFRVGGTVEFLHQVEGPGGTPRPIHEGDTLKHGEVIARLDPGDFRRDRDATASKLTTARAKLAEAKADAELAKVEFRRAEQLISRNALSKSDEDSARTKLHATSAAQSAAQSEVETAQIELAKAEANLGYCTLEVPFNEGTVAARYVERDERVAIGQKAFLVVDVSSVVIAFMVPDALVGQLSIGQHMEVTCDALPARHFTGVIHKVAATADSLTRSYPIEVRINRPNGLRPGMVANVHIRKEQRAHLLPLTAIAPGAGAGKLFQVYRANSENGKVLAQRIPVTLEAVLDNRVAIRIGPDDSLKPGDRVVATGIHRLHDGEELLVVE